MQTEPVAGQVAIDGQASGTKPGKPARPAALGQLADRFGQCGPGLAACRIAVGVAIAGAVGVPAEWAAATHRHRHALPARGDELTERRLGKHRGHVGQQGLLEGTRISPQQGRRPLLRLRSSSSAGEMASLRALLAAQQQGLRPSGRTGWRARCSATARCGAAVGRRPRCPRSWRGRPLQRLDQLGRGVVQIGLAGVDVDNENSDGRGCQGPFSLAAATR